MSDCKHEHGFSGLVGDPMMACCECGTMVNVPERSAMHRAEKAEARVAELEAAIRRAVGPFGIPRSVGIVGYLVNLERVLEGVAPSVSEPPPCQKCGLWGYCECPRPSEATTRCEKHAHIPMGRQTWTGQGWGPCVHCTKEAERCPRCEDNAADDIYPCPDHRTNEAPSEAFVSGYNAGRHGEGHYDVQQAWATFRRHGGARTDKAKSPADPRALMIELVHAFDRYSPDENIGLIDLDEKVEAIRAHINDPRSETPKADGLDRVKAVLGLDLLHDVDDILCTRCMQESADTDNTVGFNEGWATAVRAIGEWLRKVAADPRLAHAGGVDVITDAADALEVAEQWRKAPPKRARAHDQCRRRLRD